ncbi:hypothetical protein MKX01_018640 [Papaver californicum]|nr:hypothetical protein MKX01_018640 [Papaver californicum]
MDICETMHKQPEYVMNFLLAEMETVGSLDGKQNLVIKGSYVICNECKSSNTILSKEERLFFLRCELRCVGRSVAPIIPGFVARVWRQNAEP